MGVISFQEVASIRRVCKAWQTEIEALVLPQCLKRLFKLKGLDDKAELVDYLIHSVSIETLEKLIEEKLFFVKKIADFGSKKSSDLEIDKELDPGILLLKQLLKTAPEKSDRYRKTLDYVLKNKEFSICNNPKFFNVFEDAFFNRPCVLKSIRFWKWIKELSPLSQMLNPQAFLDFLMAAGGEGYSPEEVFEIKSFLDELLKNPDIKITDLDRIVGEVHFPIVYSHASDDVKSRLYSFEDTEDEWYLADLCAFTRRPYSASNIEVLLDDNQSCHELIFECALEASNVLIAFTLMKNNIFFEVDSSVIKRGFNMNLKPLPYAKRLDQIDLRLAFLETLIEQESISLHYKIAYEKVRAEFLGKLIANETEDYIMERSYMEARLISWQKIGEMEEMEDDSVEVRV